MLRILIYSLIVFGIVIIAIVIVGCSKPAVYDQQYYLDAMGIELDKEERAAQ